MENSKKKNLKWLWITLAIVAVVAVGVWCIFAAINLPKVNIKKDEAGNIVSEKTVETVRNMLNFNTTFALFTISFVVLGLGYLLGGINIKGITLGTAGVFLVAILVGYLCTLIPETGLLSPGTDSSAWTETDALRTRTHPPSAWLHLPHESAPYSDAFRRTPVLPEPWFVCSEPVHSVPENVPY